jgi:SAM-dependent methyltransferase
VDFGVPLQDYIMSPATRTVLDYLASLPTADSFPASSVVTPFQHDEFSYDRQYKHQPAELEPGRGLVGLLKMFECDEDAPCLEIGCGTGFLSLGLAANSPFPELVLSDPSTTFLQLTQEKIRHNHISEERIRYLVLKGEDLDRLPANAFSCIALRSTLHHVVDVPRFIADAAKALRPGGILVHQEPYAEGYLLLGSMVQLLPALAAAAGTPLTDAQRQTVQICTDAMVYYYRTDIPKNGEDKHVFRIEELFPLYRRVGLAPEFRANRSFEHFAPGSAYAIPLFSNWVESYLRLGLSWDPALMELFERLLRPYCRYIDSASAGNAGPLEVGVLVGKKEG